MIDFDKLDGLAVDADGNPLSFVVVNAVVNV